MQINDVKNLEPSEVLERFCEEFGVDDSTLFDLAEVCVDELGCRYDAYAFYLDHHSCPACMLEWLEDRFVDRLEAANRELQEVAAEARSEETSEGI